MTTELIDTHAHLTFPELCDQVDAVLERSIKAGVTTWLTIGTDPGENKKAVELAGRHDNLYAAVGIHPHDARLVTAEVLAELRQLAADERVVAIGETGLDYFYDNSPRAAQQRVFVEHMNIARELNLPVIIHSRKAFDDTLEILEQHGRGLRGVVFHCFSGSAEQARRLLDRGFCISFTGVVTFKNARKSVEAAKVVPIERLMVETDCPYMSPEPVRKQRPNEPALLVHTARFLAELKGLCLDDFASRTTETARDFFGLPR